ncbi:hypothetical protein B0H14DRAFT_3129570 [Mycena olivaceomarginata]|nr:hypothetical protein B0H14DRAFT_3129570 [Mycena olivaceomarginata]
MATSSQIAAYLRVAYAIGFFDSNMKLEKTKTDPGSLIHKKVPLDTTLDSNPVRYDKIKIQNIFDSNVSQSSSDFSSMLFQPNAPRNRAAHAERIDGQLGALLDATLGASDCCARSTLKMVAPRHELNSPSSPPPVIVSDASGGHTLLASSAPAIHTPEATRVTRISKYKNEFGAVGDGRPGLELSSPVQRLLRPLELDCAGPEVPTVNAPCGPLTSEHFRYNPASQHPSFSPAAIDPAWWRGFPATWREQPLQSEWTCTQGYGEHQLGIYYSDGDAFNDLDLRPQLSLDTFSHLQLTDIVTGPFGGLCPSAIPELFNSRQTAIYTPDIPRVPSYSVMPLYPCQMLAYTSGSQDWPYIATTLFEGLSPSYSANGMALQPLPTSNFGPTECAYVGWTRFDDSLAPESYSVMPQGPQRPVLNVSVAVAQFP